MHAIHPVKYAASRWVNNPSWGSICLGAVHQRPRDNIQLMPFQRSAGNIRGTIELWVLCHTTAMSDAGDENEDAQLNSFFGTILESGSSFNPAFLLVVDGTFAFLFIVLASFMVLTRGNIHLIFLTFIEVALWASVKWYVISRPGSRR